MSTIKELVPSIFLVETELSGYDDIDVRAVILNGERMSLIWDTLTHPRDMEGVQSLIKGNPLQIVYSHADWDHIWGTCSLDYDQVIGHKFCRDRFNDEVPQTLKKMVEEDPKTWKGIKLVPPSLVFEKDMNIDLGGLTLEMTHMPGHTQDSIIGYIPELGIFLGGDAVEDPFPVFNEGNSLINWIKALQGWSSHKDLKYVIPAHGQVSGPSLINDNIAYLQGLFDGTSQLPEGLVSFYLDTHKSNIENAIKSKADPI